MKKTTIKIMTTDIERTFKHSYNITTRTLKKWSKKSKIKKKIAYMMNGFYFIEARIFFLNFSQMCETIIA